MDIKELFDDYAIRNTIVLFSSVNEKQELSIKQVLFEVDDSGLYDISEVRTLVFQGVTDFYINGAIGDAYAVESVSNEDDTLHLELVLFYSKEEDEQKTLETQETFEASISANNVIIQGDNYKYTIPGEYFFCVLHVDYLVDSTEHYQILSDKKALDSFLAEIDDKYPHFFSIAGDLADRQGVSIDDYVNSRASIIDILANANSAEFVKLDANDDCIDVIKWLIETIVMSNHLPHYESCPISFSKFNEFSDIKPFIEYFIDEIAPCWATYWEGLNVAGTVYTDGSPEQFEMSDAQTRQLDPFNDLILKDIFDRIKAAYDVVLSQVPVTDKINAINTLMPYARQFQQGKYVYDGKQYDLRDIDFTGDWSFYNFNNDFSNDSDFYDYDRAVIDTLAGNKYYLILLFHAYRLSAFDSIETDLLKFVFDLLKYYLPDASIANSPETINDRLLLRNIHRLLKNNYELYADSLDKIQRLDEILARGKIETEITNEFYDAVEVNAQLSRILKKIELLETQQKYASKDEYDRIQREISVLKEESTNTINDHRRHISANRFLFLLDAIYLLTQYCEIKLVKKTIPGHKLTKELEELKNIKNDLMDIDDELCHLLYSKQRSITEYRKETGLDVSTIESQEAYYSRIIADNKSASMRRLMDVVIAGYDNYDIDSFMSQFRKEVNRVNWTEDESAWLDEVQQRVRDCIKKKLESVPAFKTILNNLKHSIGAAFILPSNLVLFTLASAEYLYQLYVTNGQEIDNFDYGCISTLYYQAFESAYNELIIAPYIDFIQSSDVRIIVSHNGYSLDKEGYWPKADYHKLINNDGLFNDSCMYEQFAYLIKSVADGDDQVKEFSSFLQKRMGNRFNKNELKRFALDIEDAREYRNLASHGGNIITYKDATRDKRNVYVNAPGTRYKELLMRLLRFLPSE